MPPLAFVSTVKTFVSAGLGIERCSKNASILPVSESGFPWSHGNFKIPQSPRLLRRCFQPHFPKKSMSKLDQTSPKEGNPWANTPGTPASRPPLPLRWPNVGAPALKPRRRRSRRRSRRRDRPADKVGWTGMRDISWWVWSFEKNHVCFFGRFWRVLGGFIQEDLGFFDGF